MEKSALASLAALAAALLLPVAGCYPERMATRYADLPEYGWDENNGAVLEKSGGPEEDAKVRIRLREIENATDAVYRLNAGDKISIRVFGHENMNLETRISPDGYIGMMLAGQVKLGGKTIDEATQAIRAGLEKYMRNPVVGLNMVEISSETATISGACAKPGMYSISDSTRVADLYAMAGGTSVRLFNGVDVDAADLSRSFIVRNGEMLPVDVEKAVREGDIDHNLHIRKGDYMFIEQRMEASVTICGAVERPHRRLFEHGIGLIEMLTYAGWMKDTRWSHAILIRNGLSNPEMYKIDIDAILVGTGRNVLLKPNDIIYIPHDDISEYNVFVKKLMPTAQLVNLLTSRITAFSP